MLVRRYRRRAVRGPAALDPDLDLDRTGFIELQRERNFRAGFERRLEAVEHHVKTTRPEQHAVIRLDLDGDKLTHAQDVAVALGSMDIGALRDGRADGDQALGNRAGVADLEIDGAIPGDRRRRARPRVIDLKGPAPVFMRLR